MKWETVPRGYFVPHAHMDTIETTFILKLGVEEKASLHASTLVHPSAAPGNSLPHWCLPKEVVAVLPLSGLPQKIKCPPELLEMH